MFTEPHGCCKGNVLPWQNSTRCRLKSGLTCGWRVMALGAVTCFIWHAGRPLKLCCHGDARAETQPFSLSMPRHQHCPHPVFWYTIFWKLLGGFRWVSFLNCRRRRCCCCFYLFLYFFVFYLLIHFSFINYSRQISTIFSLYYSYCDQFDRCINKRLKRIKLNLTKSCP